MEIAYRFTPKEINKLSKFKNPSIVLKNCRRYYKKWLI